MRRGLDLILVLALFLQLIQTTGPAGTPVLADALPTPMALASGTDSKLAPQVQANLATLAPGESLTVIVAMAEQADPRPAPGATQAARLEGVVRSLQAKATASQSQIRALLAVRQAEGKVSQITSFWVFNGLAVTADADVIRELATLAEVERITPDELSIVTSQTQNAPPEPNLSLIGAPALWNLGLYGQGVVVASMDSGVDVTHPDLGIRWRGGTNSWFDPYGQHPTKPIDVNGHGTWTMGVMVGGEAGGTRIGIAPQAQWIAVRIVNDAGSATSSAIHRGFQWLLDPDGDPSTADAPRVVNNSWSLSHPGCNLEFERDLRALRAAGIVCIFAAGNGGPAASTSYSPANNPSAVAVGATDNYDNLYAYSSRGPSSCGGPPAVFPELVAPGRGIRTTDLLASYTSASGTSLAVPHVSGGLALLLSAYPDLAPTDLLNSLFESATDLGLPGPDNDSGYGRLDLLAAYAWLANQSDATPTPVQPGAPPGAPSDPATSRVTTTAITLAWTDHASDESGFYVERSMHDEATWKRIASVGPDVTVYRDKGLWRKTTYTYRVQAYNAAGLSDFSPTVIAMTK